MTDNLPTFKIDAIKDRLDETVTTIDSAMYLFVGPEIPDRSKFSAFFFSTSRLINAAYAYKEVASEVEAWFEKQELKSFFGLDKEDADFFDIIAGRMLTTAVPDFPDKEKNKMAKVLFFAWIYLKDKVNNLMGLEELISQAIGEFNWEEVKTDRHLRENPALFPTAFGQFK